MNDSPGPAEGRPADSGWRRIWRSGRRFHERFLAWDQRTTRRIGKLLGYTPDDELPPDQRVSRAIKRGQLRVRPPIAGEAADFMTESEAEALLARPRRLPASARRLCARGILQEAWLSTGERGVTRSSVMGELEWRREASLWRRFTRAVGGVVHWM
jgi:hypothetical protein